MPKPRSADGRTNEHQLLDIHISAAGLAADTKTYVVRCRRNGDSWRLMAGELTAKLGRDVTHAWLYGTFREDPDVQAAEQTYAVELAARLAPAEVQQP